MRCNNSAQNLGLTPCSTRHERGNIWMMFYWHTRPPCPTRFVATIAFLLCGAFTRMKECRTTRMAKITGWAARGLCRGCRTVFIWSCFPGQGLHCIQKRCWFLSDAHWPVNCRSAPQVTPAGAATGAERLHLVVTKDHSGGVQAVGRTAPVFAMSSEERGGAQQTRGYRFAIAISRMTFASNCNSSRRNLTTSPMLTRPISS